MKLHAQLHCTLTGSSPDELDLREAEHRALYERELESFVRDPTARSIVRDCCGEHEVLATPGWVPPSARPERLRLTFQFTRKSIGALHYSHCTVDVHEDTPDHAPQV